MFNMYRVNLIILHSILASKLKCMLNIRLPKDYLHPYFYLGLRLYSNVGIFINIPEQFLTEREIYTSYT